MRVLGLLDVRQVLLHDPPGIADHPLPPRVQPYRLVAEALDHREPVGDEQNRLAAALELGELVEALQAEALVAHRQHLVHEEDLGVDVHGDGEPQPHVHARGVGLDRGVDEVLELGELDDLVETPVDLAAGHAQHDTVDEHVLAPADLGMKARAELDQSRDPSVDAHLAARRPGDSRHQLQQGALARPVAADDAAGRARRDRQRHVVQRPERLVRAQMPNQAAGEQRALQGR